MECTDEVRSKVAEFLQASEAGDTDRCEALKREFEEQSEELKQQIRAFLEEACQNEKSEPMLGGFWDVQSGLIGPRPKCMSSN